MASVSVSVSVSVSLSLSLSLSVSAGNDGDQLSSALVWQGAKFLAVQDDALLVGVDECVVFLSAFPMFVPSLSW